MFKHIIIREPNPLNYFMFLTFRKDNVDTALGIPVDRWDLMLISTNLHMVFRTSNITWIHLLPIHSVVSHIEPYNS